jgi:hypothetical protein
MFVFEIEVIRWSDNPIINPHVSEQISRKVDWGVWKCWGPFLHFHCLMPVCILRVNSPYYCITGGPTALTGGWRGSLQGPRPPVCMLKRPYNVRNRVQPGLDYTLGHFASCWLYGLRKLEAPTNSGDNKICQRSSAYEPKKLLILFNCWWIDHSRVQVLSVSVL